MLLPYGCGRCYCHIIASLNVLMADGITKMSWCFSTTNVDIYSMADVIAKWQME